MSCSARHHARASPLLESCQFTGTGQQISPDVAHFSPGFQREIAGNSIALIPIMNRIATNRTWAFIVLLASTLLSYAKIVGVVLSERLWRLPQRQLRTAGAIANNVSRRLP